MKFEKIPGSPELVGTQADFSAGAFPGFEDIPANGAERIEHGFLREDGAIQRRGGYTLKANADADDPVAIIWDGDLTVGHRTLFWTTEPSLYALDTDDVTPRQLATGLTGGVPAQQPVEIAGMVLAPGVTAGSRDEITVWGGRVPVKASYSTGTVTFTVDSTTVVGVGTSWTGNVEPGMVIYYNTTAGHHRAAVVKSVTDNTHIELTEPWPYVTHTTGVTAYAVATAPALILEKMDPDGDQVYLCAAQGKLFAAQGRKVWQSIRDESPSNYVGPFNFGADSYHLLPEGATVIGLAPLGDGVAVFTSAGVLLITNVAFDITDAFGNQQQAVRAITGNVYLTSARGLSLWDTTLVVPARDDLYLMTPNGELRPITGGARESWQFANLNGIWGSAVYRGHLLVSGGLGMLAWRLVDGYPFTRLVSTSLYGIAVRKTSTAALLAGGTGLLNRLCDFGAVFDPAAANKNDGHGESIPFEVTTAGMILNETRRSTFRSAHLRVELDDAGSDNPTITAAYRTGRPGGAFTNLSAALDGQQEGDVVYRFLIGKHGQQLFLRFRQSTAAAKCVLRSVKVYARPPGMP